MALRVVLCLAAACYIYAYFQPKSFLGGLIPPRLESLSVYHLFYKVLHWGYFLTCYDTPATSALFTGSVSGRKLVGDSVWPSCFLSQFGAPKLTWASFLFLFSFTRWNTERCSSFVKALSNPGPLPPLNGHKVKKVSYTKVIPYA